MTPNDIHIDGDWEDMNNPAYLALFNSREEAYKRTKELEAQLAAAQAKIARQQQVIFLSNIAINDAQAEITRLRSGGCAREQGATQYCAEAQKLAEDAAMLDWLADHEAVKNINGVNLSIYETAMCIAYERDVDAEPTVEDYRQALRLMIRTARNAEAAHSGEEKQ